MRSSTIRLIVSLLCLAAGAAGGWLVRRSGAPDPVAAAPVKRPVQSPRISWTRRPVPDAAAPLNEEATKSMVPLTFASDFRLAARIAAFTPGQARKHLESRFSQRNAWLSELLWFKVAAEDPAATFAAQPALEADTHPENDTGIKTESQTMLRGIFRAWVRRDAAAAQRAATATDQRLNVFVQEWAAFDPAAATRALEAGKIPRAMLRDIMAAWVRRAPGAAAAWIQAGHDAAFIGKPPHGSSATNAPSLAGDPLAEWRGEMLAELHLKRIAAEPAAAWPDLIAMEWGRPWTRDDKERSAPYNCLDDRVGLAIQTVAALSPDLAIRLAGELPQERLTVPIAGSVIHALHSAKPGAGTAWAATLTDPALQAAVVRGFASPGSHASDFPSAVRALDGAPAAVIGPAARRIVEEWVALDPGAVHSWLTGPLPEMSARDAAALRKEFNDHVRPRLPKLVLPK